MSLGYNFPTAEAIKPYLERPETGQTSLFCKALAERLRCHVMAGYPEGFSKGSDTQEKISENAVGFNSAIIYGPDGQFCGGYRKTNLFRADLPWAQAGIYFNLKE